MFREEATSRTVMPVTGLASRDFHEGGLTTSTSGVLWNGCWRGLSSLLCYRQPDAQHKQDAELAVRHSLPQPDLNPGVAHAALLEPGAGVTLRGLGLAHLGRPVLPHRDQALVGPDSERQVLQNGPAGLGKLYQPGGQPRVTVAQPLSSQSRGYPCSVSFWYSSGSLAPLGGLAPSLTF